MPVKLNKPRVLGVLAGEDFPVERLLSWANSAEIVLAADGAANRLISVGFIPDTTVGDLDSIAESTKSAQRELILNSDQNHTDCDKLLSLAQERGFVEVTLVGIEGDLVDHLLGSIASAAKSSQQIRIILRRGLAYILKGPCDHHFAFPPNTRLSLLPLTSCEGVNLQGVEWPLDQAELSPLGNMSLSNRGLGKIQFSIKLGTAVLFVAHPDLEAPHWHS